MDGAHWVVGQHPVFYHQGGNQCFGVLIEEGVVAHTKPQTNIELGVLAVEQLGLGNGVAHGLKLAGLELALLRHPGPGLVQSAGLADDGHHLEAVIPQDPLHHSGLLLQCRTESQTQLLIVHGSGELHDLLQAGPAAVASRLDGGAGDKKVVVFL